MRKIKIKVLQPPAAGQLKNHTLTSYIAVCVGWKKDKTGNGAEHGAFYCADFGGRRSLLHFFSAVVIMANTPQSVQ